RMLDDPRARDTIAHFHDQWLGIIDLDQTEKDPTVYPAWDDQLKSSLMQETEQFVDAVIRRGDARLGTLLTASYSFLDGPSASLYGVASPPSAWARVELPPTERAG